MVLKTRSHKFHFPGQLRKLQNCSEQQPLFKTYGSYTTVRRNSSLHTPVLPHDPNLCTHKCRGILAHHTPWALGPHSPYNLQILSSHCEEKCTCVHTDILLSVSVYIKNTLHHSFPFMF